MSLVDSKTNTDMLLDDNVIILEIEDLNITNEFLEEAERIGVCCKLLS